MACPSLHGCGLIGVCSIFVGNILDMKKPYKAKEQEPMFVNEPMTQYNVMGIGREPFFIR